MKDSAEPHRFFERQPSQAEQEKTSAYQEIFNIYKEKIEQKRAQLNSTLAQLQEQTVCLAKIYEQAENELTPEKTDETKNALDIIKSLEMTEEKLRQEIDSLIFEDDISLIDLHLHNPEVEN